MLQLLTVRVGVAARLSPRFLNCRRRENVRCHPQALSANRQELDRELLLALQARIVWAAHEDAAAVRALERMDQMRFRVFCSAPSISFARRSTRSCHSARLSERIAGGN